MWHMLQLDLNFSHILWLLGLLYCVIQAGNIHGPDGVWKQLVEMPCQTEVGEYPSFTQVL